MPVPIDTPLIADGALVRFARSAQGGVRLESWRDGAWAATKPEVSWSRVMTHSHPATTEELRSAGLPDWQVRRHGKGAMG